MRMIRVIEESDKDIFESKVNELLDKGFILQSSSCGFVDSERYDFCSSYHAILLYSE